MTLFWQLVFIVLMVKPDHYSFEGSASRPVERWRWWAYCFSIIWEEHTPIAMMFDSMMLHQLILHALPYTHHSFGIIVRAALFW